MEDLIELVAASLARNGIECPSDPTLVWGRPSSCVQVHAESDAFTCSPERGSATDDNSVSVQAIKDRPTEPALIAPFPEHNFRKNLQGDPAP
jgi:hypothetical protein